MEFRIEKVDDAAGVVTGALVFTPAPALPEPVRFTIERFGRENSMLGPHGWAVNPPALVPRRIEKRGASLWLLFGAEVSYWVEPGTAVLVRLAGTDVEGSDVWPPIPRGKAPPAPPRETESAPPPVPEPRPEPRPDPKPEPEPQPQPQPEPAPPKPAEEETVRMPPPGPVKREPEPPPVIVDPLPPPPIDGRPPPRVPLLVGLGLLLLAAGGGAWWWLNREPEPPPAPPVAQPQPQPQPQPQAPTGANPCTDVAQVLDGACSREALAALPPAEATRLARALLERGGATADGLALSLLISTVSRHGYGEAALLLAGLYDPHSHREGGPVPTPNRNRALDLYRQAVQGTATGAQAALDAYLGRLRAEVAAGGPAAAEAQAVLRRADGG
jgi:hypothetical protein